MGVSVVLDWQHRLASPVDSSLSFEVSFFCLTDFMAATRSFFFPYYSFLHSASFVYLLLPSKGQMEITKSGRSLENNVFSFISTPVSSTAFFFYILIIIRLDGGLKMFVCL